MAEMSKLNPLRHTRQADHGCFPRSGLAAESINLPSDRLDGLCGFRVRVRADRHRGCDFVRTADRLIAAGAAGSRWVGVAPRARSRETCAGSLSPLELL